MTLDKITPIYRPRASGNYYGPDTTGTVATLTVGAYQHFFAAMTVDAPITIDRIGIEVTSAGANSACRVGIYDDSFGVPKNLILDGGTVDSTGTGFLENVVSKRLTAGFYWLAIHNEKAAATPPSTIVVRALHASGGSNPYVGNTSAQTTGMYAMYNKYDTASAFLDPMVTPSPNVSAPPRVQYRIA